MVKLNGDGVYYSGLVVCSKLLVGFIVFYIKGCDRL